MPESGLHIEDFRPVFVDDRRTKLLFAISNLSIEPPELFYIAQFTEELGISRTTLTTRLKGLEQASMIERIGTPSYDRREPYARVEHPLWPVVQLAESLNI
jgi:DNA-binding transcriptional regulator GbsR (MarR family)